MRTVKILKNIKLTLAPIHKELNVGQYFDSYYTNGNKNITVTKVHRRIETESYDRKYLIDAIEVV